MRSHTVEIAEGDALVIPARFRQELGLEVGDSVMLDIATANFAFARVMPSSPTRKSSCGPWCR